MVLSDLTHPCVLATTTLDPNKLTLFSEYEQVPMIMNSSHECEEAKASRLSELELRRSGPRRCWITAPNHRDAYDAICLLECYGLQLLSSAHAIREPHDF